MVSEGRATDPGLDAEEEAAKRRRRFLALMALLVAAVIAYLLLTGGDEYRVTAEFENASQLVTGNEVVIGGTNAGSVKEIELGPEGQALVTF
ncbi:MAG: MlaD family protein, partial [Solirubrobacterales bacterium]